MPYIHIGIKDYAELKRIAEMRRKCRNTHSTSTTDVSTSTTDVSTTDVSTSVYRLTSLVMLKMKYRNKWH